MKIIKTVLFGAVLLAGCSNPQTKQKNNTDTAQANKPTTEICNQQDNDSFKNQIKLLSTINVPLGLKNEFFFNFRKHGILWALPQDIKNDSASKFLERLEEQTPHKGKFLLKQAQCYYVLLIGERAASGNTDFSLVIFDKSGNKIDSLSIFKIQNVESIMKTTYSYNRYYYISSDFEIYIKNFRISPEFEYYNYFNSDIYTINDNGHFVKYFDEENGNIEKVDSVITETTKGIFNFEKGNVKNHFKTGVWEEFSTPLNTTIYKGKTNRQAGREDIEPLLYGTGNYLNGVKDGTWSYFEIIENKTNSNSMALTTKRKNTILIKEQYDKGTLIKKEVLINP
ncbi:MAG TPA: hypothetical protein VEC12_09865 [Bacteroidia bacterium]|nr:hypothetical protein [Bacteroidia bacterium]